MRYLKRILLLILIFIVVTATFACKKKPSSSSEKEGNTSNKIVELTNYKLVESGNSDYKIVLPTSADYLENEAANELQLFFKEATGIVLPIIEETGLTATEQTQYLILGKTVMSMALNVEPSYDTVGEQGFVLKTINQNVVLKGYKSEGTLFAVYEFLKYQFGFRCYAQDEFGLEKGVVDKNLFKYDVTEVPAITYRETGYTNMVTDEYEQRLRMGKKSDFMAVNGASTHNALSYILPVKYEKSHPNWYGPGDLNDKHRQLCYTARGDESELELMRAAVFDSLKNTVLSNPNYDLVQFSKGDGNNGWCGCSACKKMIADYGGCQVAPIIKFINPIAKQLKEWLALTAPDRHVTIVIMAYAYTTNAPVKYNKDTKVYEPIDDTVKMEDNLGVLYCPITANLYEDFNTSRNTAIREIMTKWSALTNNILLWNYSVNINSYIAFMDTISSLQTNYQLFDKLNVQYNFNQSLNESTNCTAFNVLKAFLVAEMSWDPYQDFDKLVDDFFKNYFKEAAEPMREYYDSLLAHYKAKYDEGKIIADFDESRILSLAVWPRSKLEEWQQILEKAYASIDSLKTIDADKYAKLYDRITLESISVRWLIVELYSTKYDAAYITQMKNLLKEDMRRLKVDRLAEGVSA